jgi:uncharacterized protein YdaU (DUF1376 family)
MHYYQFNIGDYAAHTRHLSLLEDLAYRRLLDLYYSSEKPLITDIKKLARLLIMTGNESEIRQVLEDFFRLSDHGYIQNRVDDEIAKYHAKADSARSNGKKGGRPKKPTANPRESGSKAKQETGTTNHETGTSLKAVSQNDIDINIVFEFWKAVMKKNSRTTLNKDRGSKIKARLKEGYSVDEIKLAVTNCSNDNWHIEKNVNDIEYICRNQQHLDKFIEKKPDQQQVQHDDTSWGNNMQDAYIPNQQKALGHE